MIDHRAAEQLLMAHRPRRHDEARVALEQERSPRGRLLAIPHEERERREWPVFGSSRPVSATLTSVGEPNRRRERPRPRANLRGRGEKRVHGQRGEEDDADLARQ